MDINTELERFIIDKFTFKTFEIDNWLNDKRIYRYKFKNDAEAIEGELGIDYLGRNGLNDWIYIEKRTINYFFDEFAWHIIGTYNAKTAKKLKKRFLKEYILDVIKNQAELVRFDKRIKPFFKSQRIKVHRTISLPNNQRKPIGDLKIGDRCYIFRYGGGMNSSNKPTTFRK